MRRFVRRKFMTTVRRIGPGSAFKVGAAVYAMMGLILGFITASVSILVGTRVQGAEAGVFRMFFGVGAIVFLPILYAVIGGVFSVLSALFYNLVADWLGGLEVELS
jgi:hypothetical protein